MSDETKCTAAANIAGEHVPCDNPAPHGGWAHANREHELIWAGPVGQDTTSHDAAAAVHAVNALSRVRAVLKHAQMISPSASMSVYVADIECALGDDVARPHKLGAEQ